MGCHYYCNVTNYLECYEQRNFQILLLGALRQMLNLNQPQTKALAAEPVWKILVYDRYGQDIISPLVSIKELRESGVTLHV